MQRLIYNPDTKEILDLIDSCEGTSTGTPFEMFEGSPEEVYDKIDELDLVAVNIALPPRPQGAKKISKFELIGKLVALDLVDEFHSLINGLPLVERLKWDAAQNISEDYPFLVENRALILESLNLTPEQFDDLFK
jgi:hypothetical protein